jgi:hypothetical protein
LIKFITENIESSHISTKYIDFLINSKNPNDIVNGLLLLGHWANTYPNKYIHSRILDILFVLKKSIDLKIVFTKDELSQKFLKGIYLFFKAFPQNSEEILSFLNHLKSNVNNLCSDYTQNNKLKTMINKTLIFLQNTIIDGNYCNENTLYYNLNK